MNGIAKNLIKAHEGLRLKPYRDTEGHLTIGYGRNLEGGITEIEAEILFSNDYYRAERDLMSVFPECIQWNDNVQAALLSMSFNLGKTRFLTFKRMIAAIENHDWGEAVREMRDSRWYQQVPARAEAIASLILENT